jgi:hypothetical protein
LLLKQAPAAPDIVGTSYDETINGSRSSLTSNCSVPFKRIVFLGTLKGRSNNGGRPSLRGQFERRRRKGFDLKIRLHPLVDRPKQKERPAAVNRRPEIVSEL